MCAVIIGAGCGSKDKKETGGGKTRSPASAAPEAEATRTVKVDNRTDKYNGAFLAYFPKEVTVRPGDTVEFESIFTGEPHTVTMGKLVEAGLDAAKGASQDGPPPPALASLPSLFPEGPGDAHQNAAQPCYLETGTPPSDQEDKACAKVPQPSFNGRQPYYNSGFLADKDRFKVKLADDITPGAYRYYCNLHGPDMQGTINVQAKGSPIPSAEDVTKAAQSELDQIVNPLVTAYGEAKAGKAPFPGNLAGFGAEKSQGLIDEFIPATITAKVGEKVTWTVVGPHTISFGSPPDLKQTAIEKAPDGSVHIVQKVAMPQGGPGMPQGPPPSGPPPTGPPPPPKVVDGGKYDGTGFHSTGLFLSFPPHLLGYSLTFTKPGTYSYVCLVHPGMGGVVNVKA